jgi:hypothetical protein
VPTGPTGNQTGFGLAQARTLPLVCRIEAYQPGGDEAVVAKPGSVAAAAAGDGGEITTAGTDSADGTAAAGERGRGLPVYGDT